VRPDDVVTFYQMCEFEQAGMLQKGMTFRPPPLHGIILMSQRPNAPYADILDDDGNLVYEGHDAPRTPATPNPKTVDQPRRGENAKFADWTDRYRRAEVPPARFHVYEKLIKGMWNFRGAFLLKDYRIEFSGGRDVFKFVLQAIDEPNGEAAPLASAQEIAQTRQIPTWVKQEVYKRDRGRCVLCGATDQLHFDHDLPFSKGGASATPANVRLLCMRCNLSKGAKIE